MSDIHIHIDRETPVKVITLEPNGARGAAATITVGTTTTGAAGTNASVTNSGTSSAAVFDFTIPRGDTGATGATGAAGPNSVTSATASDGTAELDVLMINADVEGGYVGARTIEALESLQSDARTTLGGELIFSGNMSFDYQTGVAQTHREALEIGAQEVKSANFTAADKGEYVSVATLAVTDPAPSEGASFSVLVRNGTATVGGVAYSVAGTLIRRVYHSGAWASYVTATIDQVATLTNKTISGGTLTNTTTTGTLTLNSTTYTYGTGAGLAHMAALVSASGLQAVQIYDDFIGISTANGAVGAYGWGATGTITLRGSEVNHPGIIRVSTAATGAIYSNFLSASGAGDPDMLNGFTAEAAWRINSTTNCRYTFGIGGVNFYNGNGVRALHFDPALSANWRVLHLTNAGVATYTDTGKTAVAGEWVRVKLLFASGITTCTIATASSPMEATVSNSGAYTPSGTPGHALQFVSNATSGTHTFDVDCVGIYGTSTRL